MVCSTQNCWGFGLFLGVETTCFGHCICFRPQVKGGRRHLLSWASWKELIAFT
jgi:hypothetical protein